MGYALNKRKTEITLLSGEVTFIRLSFEVTIIRPRSYGAPPRKARGWREATGAYDTNLKK